MSDLAGMVAGEINADAARGPLPGYPVSGVGVDLDPGTMTKQADGPRVRPRRTRVKGERWRRAIADATAKADDAWLFSNQRQAVSWARAKLGFTVATARQRRSVRFGGPELEIEALNRATGLRQLLRFVDLEGDVGEHLAVVERALRERLSQFQGDLLIERKAVQAVRGYEGMRGEGGRAPKMPAATLAAVAERLLRSGEAQGWFDSTEPRARLLDLAMWLLPDDDAAAHEALRKRFEKALASHKPR